MFYRTAQCTNCNTVLAWQNPFTSVWWTNIEIGRFNLPTNLHGDYDHYETFCPHCGSSSTSGISVIKAHKWISTSKWYLPWTYFGGYWK